MLYWFVLIAYRSGNCSFNGISSNHILVDIFSFFHCQFSAYTVKDLFQRLLMCFQLKHHRLLLQYSCTTQFFHIFRHNIFPLIITVIINLLSVLDSYFVAAEFFALKPSDFLFLLIILLSNGSASGPDFPPTGISSYSVQFPFHTLGRGKYRHYMCGDFIDYTINQVQPASK